MQPILVPRVRSAYAKFRGFKSPSNFKRKGQCKIIAVINIIPGVKLNENEGKSKILKMYLILFKL